jgi:capsule polysaccharide export protein KpsE/RkpR
MESYFKTKSIFGLIARWKWHLLIITVASAILGLVFSGPYFIHPKYKSAATLYPANIICMSDESESEQMLEILGSDDIKFQMIEKYELYSHYGIDSTENNSLAKIMSQYNSNVFFEKTSNDAITITVCDEDPQIAANMVNSIIEFYDKFVLKLNALKSEEVLDIYSKSAKEKEHIIDSLSEVIKKYRTEYGLIDQESQTKAYSEGAALGRLNNDAILKNWQIYGAEYAKTDSLLTNTIQRYNKDLKICEDARRDINKEQSYSHIISKPYVADKKFYPVRWIITLLAGLGGCLIGIIAIAIIEGCRKPKEEIDTQN